jgi:hypothetical protein
MNRTVLRSLGIVACSALGVVVAGCGLPQSSEFEPISQTDIQFGLDQTTTPTTTTTPPTTVDATTTTQLETTTTFATEEVLVYFVSGSQLTGFPRTIASPATPNQVLRSLLEGPPSGDIGIGLRTTIPAITVVRDRGTAIIDLPARVLDLVPVRDQKLFFAQLVLTIGRLGGIGPVQFTQDGEPIGVVRGDSSTPTGDESTTVTIDDYAQLLVGAPTLASTTTTTTTTTTTAVQPPPDDESSPTSSVGG